MAREDTPLDQETFDRVLAEELAKGGDRRVAEGRARAAAVKAYRALHGEEAAAGAPSGGPASAASEQPAASAGAEPPAAPAAAPPPTAAQPPATAPAGVAAATATSRQAPGPTGNVPEPKKGAEEKHRLLALVPPEGIQRVEREQGDRINVWPHLLIEEFIAMLIVLAGITIFSTFVNAPLRELANPNLTPNPSKAPWYFVGLQEDLIYYDPWIAGVLLPGFIILGLMAIPYLDKNPKGNGYYTYAQRKYAWLFFFVGFLVLWIAPILIGTFLRGPNQAIFGPFEQWDPHKLPPIVSVDLADYFWINLLGKPKPVEWYLRELPGFLVVGAYFLVLPGILAKTIFKKLYQELGSVRFGVFAFLLISMVALPIKMLLRWTVNMKYFVSIPEAFFNI